MDERETIYPIRQLVRKCRRPLRKRWSQAEQNGYLQLDANLKGWRKLADLWFQMCYTCNYPCVCWEPGYSDFESVTMSLAKTSYRFSRGDLEYIARSLQNVGVTVLDRVPEPQTGLLGHACVSDLHVDINVGPQYHIAPLMAIWLLHLALDAAERQTGTRPTLQSLEAEALDAQH